MIQILVLNGCTLEKIGFLTRRYSMYFFNICNLIFQNFLNLSRLFDQKEKERD
jgi:hypothetical protein